MILHWRQEIAPLKLQWLGPNKVNLGAISSMNVVEDKIAVIMGPRGNPGEQGPVGPRGERGENAIVVVDDTGLTAIDGGFF